MDKITVSTVIGIVMFVVVVMTLAYHMGYKTGYSACVQEYQTTGNK